MAIQILTTYQTYFKMTEPNKEKLLYEDKVAYAVLAEHPSALGHIQIYPKQKVSTLEELQDEVVQQLFFIASFAASAVFEGLGAHGTNIIVQDGKALNKGQLYIDVIPRKMDDSIDFKWEPQKLQPEEMESIQNQIKDRADYIGEEGEKKEEIKAPSPDKEEEMGKEEDNYLVKHLYRRA